MRFDVTLDRDEDGVWVVECPAIPGCVSQGQTKEEAIENIKDAIKLALEVRAERGMPLTVEVDDEEFEREVALVQQNGGLMDLLDRRSRPGKSYSIEEARQILGIEESSCFVEVHEHDGDSSLPDGLRIPTAAHDIAGDREGRE